jgi:hypothetical protein
MRTISLLTGTLVLAAALVGCGGGETPPAKAPEAEKAPAKASEQKSEPKSEAMADSKAESKAEPKASHKPAKEIIGDPDLSFQYSFRDSDIREKTEEACTKKSKDDPEKKAACMSKAQGDLEGEHLRFIKLDGEDWFVIVAKGKELHRIKYSIAKDSPNQVTIKLIPPDKAKQPKGKLPMEFTIEVIDDYTISTNDPEEGKRVYKAKTGLFTETSTTKGGGGEAAADKSKKDTAAEKPKKKGK